MNANEQKLSYWLHYLEQLNPQKIQLGLKRVSSIAEKLGIQKFLCPVITVGGTNGKGSCVAFLESIFLTAGYKTGAYTSPHLLQFNERICINGQMIDDAALCKAFAKVYEINDLPLTYFEFTTLAALLIFQQANLDIVILEVGLGGRLDAVNIIDADVAVITTIDIDHVEWLGNNRESIGKEKAGIFRKNKLAVCGDFFPPDTVIAAAKNLDTKLYCLNKDFFYEYSHPYWQWYTATQQWNHLPLPHLELQNAATALMAVNLLPEFKIPQKTIAEGLKNAQIAGRFQKIMVKENCLCIFDVAHNPHAATWLAKQLEKEPCKGKTLAVVGMLADKDRHGTLHSISQFIDVWYVGGVDNPRGATAEQLIATLQGIQVKKWYNLPFVEEAFKKALAACGKEDRIVIFGSFYTVATCLGQIG